MVMKKDEQAADEDQDANVGDLNLNKETVRDLADTELDKARGGLLRYTLNCPDITSTCVTCYICTFEL